MKGYCEALEQAGIAIHDQYVKLGDFSVDEGFRYMKQLMELEDKPTAVFLSNYETALGGIMALNESDLSCPEDVSIIAFDDLLVSNVVRPSLWLVVQPMEGMCSSAVRVLLERIEKTREEEPAKLSFNAKIRQGSSIKDIG